MAWITTYDVGFDDFDLQAPPQQLPESVDFAVESVDVLVEDFALDPLLLLLPPAPPVEVDP